MPAFPPRKASPAQATPRFKKVLIIRSSLTLALSQLFTCPVQDRSLGLAKARFPHSQAGENDRSYSGHINVKYVNTKSIPAYCATY